ncbi:hypothetical protein SAMD00019534_126190, partial [Acytostelium subglobosum LB1]|uniref:hypothetical protein n=1 Tax=Acytostelium subglobosum LB1 TaxID=1410327 RepID=UPI000644B21A
MNGEINSGMIPFSVTNLNLSSGRHPIPSGCIPTSVVTLSIDFKCNDVVIPHSVKHLTLPKFNQDILTFIPLSVTHLSFGDIFNKHISSNILSSSVVKISFGNLFNQKIIEGCFPSSVTEISFGLRFNQTLNKGVLPPSLTKLSFSTAYTQLIQPEAIPSVTHLVIGERYPHNLDGFFDDCPNIHTLILHNPSIFQKPPARKLKEIIVYVSKEFLHPSHVMLRPPPGMTSILKSASTVTIDLNGQYTIQSRMLDDLSVVIMSSSPFHIGFLHLYHANSSQQSIYVCSHEDD